MKPICIWIVLTKLSHNSEDRAKVDNCRDPGCYSRKIEYDAPMEQILSLIELSDTCSQVWKIEDSSLGWHSTQFDS